MNRFAFICRRIIRRTRVIGFRAMLKEALFKLFSGSHQSDDFDARFGTNTAGSTSLWQLKIAAPDAIYGVNYKSVPEGRIASAIQDIPRDVAFVDLGCGKGRVLIVAAMMGFRSITGVEIAPQLIAIAKENLLKARIRAQLFCISAAEYHFPPDEPLAVYLYNPFLIEVMSPVVKRLRERPGEVWIVYLNANLSPGCRQLFEDWLGKGIESDGDHRWTNSARTHANSGAAL